MRSEIIKPVKKVRGGVSVSHEKHTKDMQVKRIPAPETVTLPMSQHIANGKGRRQSSCRSGSRRYR